MPLLLLLCSLLLTPCSLLAADLGTGENIIQALPQGYQVGFNTIQGKVQLTQLVPAGQTVDNWNELVATQIFLGGAPQKSLGDFYRATADAWGQACPGAQQELVKTGPEKGYEVAFWIQICPQNPQTKKPEFTWFKALAGKDNFYLVQKSWAYEPNQNEVAKWSGYLRDIYLCDNRNSETPCPQVKN